jgi:hypothetical protein
MAAAHATSGRPISFRSTRNNIQAAATWIARFTAW